MTKRLYFFVILFCIFSLNARCQSIKDEPSYLRQLNYFWGITNSFTKVRTEMEKHSDKITTTRNEQIVTITRLLEKSKADFEKLKISYPTDKEFKDIEQIRMVLQSSLVSLQDIKKSGPPLWQMMSFLTQMKLEDKLAE